MTILISPLLRARAVEWLDRARNDILDMAASGARRLSSDDLVPPRIADGISQRRPPARHRMMPLLETFARVHQDPFFVQIGSHDGQQQDHLRDLIVQHNWTGIMVEPVPYVFERLRRNYGHLERITLESVAIGPSDGMVPFYHLADTDDAGRPGLPIWFDALGSLRRDVVLAHQPYIPDIEERLVETAVPCLTFDSLCRRHGVDAIDILLTDTEGYDYEILRCVDFSCVRPKMIIYESLHLSELEKAACVEYLEGFGYRTQAYWHDTWCLNPDSLTESEREALLPIWQWTADAEHRAGSLLVMRALRAGARRILGAHGR